MKKLSRVLASNGDECPFQCIYCFAKTSQYKTFSSQLVPINRAFELPADIFYPSCDSEFILNKKLRRNLEELITNSNRKIVVSFSTKADCSLQALDELANLDSMLKSKKRGFIKFGISVTTKSRIHEIEKGTNNYTARLSLADSISSREMFSSINLKPILPQIDTVEYLDIVSDFSRFGFPFLLGPLYFDPLTVLGSYIIKNFSKDIGERKVDWLPDNPSWMAYINTKKHAEIEASIRETGNSSFQTDIDLLAYLLERGETSNV